MSTLRALLLDLDDTLLGNSMTTFVPAYFEALTRHLAHLVDPHVLTSRLLAATRVMQIGEGRGPTNAERFAAAFFPALDVERSRLEREIEVFYAEVFPTLAGLTQRRPTARRIVAWAEERGLQVVVATNPLFPRAAIEERMRWAGVSAADHDYALVTCYENMHATKASPQYYVEILRRLGRRPEECLMVGDDWWGDIVHAARAGIPGFWIAASGRRPPSSDATPAGQGDLGALEMFLSSRRT
jgi:HAD superfamily hydrolase (TIGR01549 family)